MKKVFSVKKYEESISDIFNSKMWKEMAKELWANDCDGLTAEEMFKQYGLLTNDSWMIEVEEGEQK